MAKRHAPGHVYLIHFSRPYLGGVRAGRRVRVRHYLGHAKSLDGRMEEHRKGHGAKLLAAVAAAGIPFKIVRVWKNGSRDFERRLKNRSEHAQLCPMCSGRKAYRRGRQA